MRVHVLESIVLALLLGGCSRVTVRSVHDPQASFAGLRTWAWHSAKLATGDPRVDDRFIDAALGRAVERELKAKGYDHRPGGEVDFLVGFHGDVEGRESGHRMDERYRYVRNAYWYHPDTREQTYDVGTLVIDVIDPRAERLLWRATGTGVLRPGSKPATRQKRVDDLVGRMLRGFPPDRR